MPILNNQKSLLGVPMKKHNENGLKIARFLKQHKKVSKITYPGLPNHPQKEIAKKQMNGFGGIVTFLFNGNLNQIKTFMKKLKLFTIAESLGGVESLIESPALMTHAYLDDSDKNQSIPKNLIRISAGIENADDLINDLKQALKS